MSDVGYVRAGSWHRHWHHGNWITHNWVISRMNSWATEQKKESLYFSTVGCPLVQWFFNFFDYWTTDTPMLTPLSYTLTLQSTFKSSHLWFFSSPTTEYKCSERNNKLSPANLAHLYFDFDFNILEVFLLSCHIFNANVTEKSVIFATPFFSK